MITECFVFSVFFLDPAITYTYLKKNRYLVTVLNQSAVDCWLPYLFAELLQNSFLKENIRTRWIQCVFLRAYFFCFTKNEQSTATLYTKTWKFCVSRNFLRIWCISPDQLTVFIKASTTNVQRLHTLSITGETFTLCALKKYLITRENVQVAPIYSFASVTACQHWDSLQVWQDTSKKTVERNISIIMLQ